MATFTVDVVRANLTELLDRVATGEEIIIMRGDTPVAVLKAFDVEDLAAARRAGEGSLAGKFPPIPDDVWFKPMTDEDMVEMFGEEFAELHRTPDDKGGT